MKILVTGSNGQLGKCLKNIIEEDYVERRWIFKEHKDFDITDNDFIEKYFSEHQIDVIINCAAYTNVNKAEVDKENAYKVNAEGAYILSKISKKYNITLIHISTDYIFDGKKNTPIDVNDIVYINPLNVYGKSKLEGEKYIQDSGCKYIIIRTSWLYSEYGDNFLTKIIKKINNNENIKIVNDQVGSPTSANDLAFFLFYIIELNKIYKSGIYHFSNKGVASWYDFAHYISTFFPESFSYIDPCSTSDLKSEIIRPNYSVLDTSKTEKDFNYQINNWMVGVYETIAKIK